MKSYLTRILVCVIPVVVSAVVVGWAYNRYVHGEGGFRLGVDLVGGTILVYEVDRTKLQGDQEYKPEELAAALKRRIDPADLYNVTIRPAGGGGERVEIILPTGGRQQRNAEEEAWRALLNDTQAKYPAPEGFAYTDVPFGKKEELRRRILDWHKEASGEEVAAFLDDHFKIAKGRRALTSEEIETIKGLIQQQGRLEFRILANQHDDREAITRAREFVKNPDNAARLKRLNEEGLPPPPPTNENGGSTFTVTLADQATGDYSYSWVEVGKEELYTLHLNNSALKKYHPEIDAARDKEAVDLGSILLYSRTITPLSRRTPKDADLGKVYEYFILTRNPERGQEVTGEFLNGAQAGVGERGGWEVRFHFNSEGANRFEALTRANRPSQGKTIMRQLAIILDGQIRSAPNLESPIRDSGRITGNFTKKEVDTIVAVLRAGALPATLKPTPASENTMGATLGEDTIRKGTLSVGLAFLAVLLFMLFYYRFAGVVACIALLANLLLTVAFMVLVNATFTLPGLAGLVLMLGMAVDANVLIYERLREERERGASLALAIRNGYDRAFPTIIDTHLSSIFTAIVLYVVGNDQLKGFGISLTVGLIISLFTSLFMTRTMFDYWMSRNWLHQLRFRQLFRRPNIDFMGIRYYWFAATVFLTILGGALFFYRLSPDAKGGSVLAIDFQGGTAYTGRLATPMTIDELRKLLEREDVPVPGLKAEETQLPDLRIEQIFLSGDTGGKSTLFTVRTENRNAGHVQRIISARMGDALKRVSLRTPEISKDNKSAILEFFNPATGEKDYASRAQVTRLLAKPGEKEEGLRNFTVEIGPDSVEQEGRFSKMKVELTDPMDRSEFEKILAQTKEAFDNSPQPERLENFDAQLAEKTQTIALYAILASWAAILLYLWFRFGSWTFGAATVLCLIHDLFFTLGFIAAAHFLHNTFLGHMVVNLFGIQIDLSVGDFKIDLNTIAALLTLVGYSVNDTIVVFDRIREVRGKNPALTATMINDSVNQTLSRTILSSLTVWLVVIVLFAFGGEGVHLFGFVMIVGVIVGTYSSIYIASPLLLIFREGTPRARDRARMVQPAAATEG
jgi:SecD/SecF fusion protein